MPDKIDLAQIERTYASTPVIALVRAVRAAMAVIDQYELGEVDHRALKRLSAFLDTFTDSAENDDD